MKKRKHIKHFKRSTRIKLLKAFADAVIKGIGVALFFIGIGALAECPTDPRQIVQALGFFIFGICIIGYNSYLIEKKENTKL